MMPPVHAQAPHDFAELRARIDAAGLLERGEGSYYWWKAASALGLWTLGVAVLLWTRHPAIVLLDAVYMAFVYGQISLIWHDAGHRQIFEKDVWNDCFAYPCAALICVSTQRWIENHNKHHAHPNHEDGDPDIEFPMVAFSERQARAKHGIERWIVTQQGWLIFALVPMTIFAMRVMGLWYVFTHKPSHIWRDALCYLLHLSLYLLTLFWLLPWWLAVAFILIHQCLFGVYMGMMFAPNHKGMPIFDADEKIDFLRKQVLTSRNIRAHWLTDFWYGGLNYQIEHHLFPHMPRKNLRRAQQIVKVFCAERGVPYHETGWIESFREIFRHMTAIARYARDLPKTAL